MTDAPKKISKAVLKKRYETMDLDDLSTVVNTLHEVYKAHVETPKRSTDAEPQASTAAERVAAEQAYLLASNVYDARTGGIAR